MKRSLVISVATAVALFASTPVYAGFGWNGSRINGLGLNGAAWNALGQNALGQNGSRINGLIWNSNQTSAAAQPGLNLTFEGVTLSTGETLVAK